MDPPQDLNKRDTIWVLSYSVAGNDFAFEKIGPANHSLSLAIAFERTALQKPLGIQSEPDQVARNRRLCAVVLVIEHAGFDDPHYRKMIKWCIQRVASQDDFRLFIALYDMTVDHLDRLAKSEPDHCAATLRDTVQFLSANEDDLKASLVGFLENINDIRDAARRRRAWSNLSRAAGYVATIIQLTSVIGVLAVGVSIFYIEPRTPVDITILSKTLIALMIGAITFPLTVYCLAILIKRDLLNFELVRDAKTSLVLLSLFLPPLSLFILALSAELMIRIDGSYSWLAAGIVAGILIDTARHNGYRAHLALTEVGPYTTLTPKGQSPPQWLMDTINGQPPSLLNTPIFSGKDAHVFISYTHSLEWSSSWAQKLYSAFHTARIECFLDSFSIREGSCWRKTLNRGLGESNVFIALMENGSLHREWPAAELEAALRSMKLTGAPDIFVLTHPIMYVEGDQPPWPIFDAFLKRRAALKNPRLMKLEDTTIKVLVEELQTYRFHLTNAIVPRALDVGLRALAALPMSILLLVGPCSTIFGWLATALALLQAIGTADTRGFLLSYSLLTPTFLLCGFWAGFVGRLAVASRFEVRLPQKESISKAHGLMAVGYLVLLMQWSPMVQPLIITWAILLCGIGWVSGSSFIFYIRQEKPETGRNLS